MSKIPDFETLEEAKQYLRENWDEGANCPCCTQFVKIWREPIHAGQAVWLIYLVKAYQQDKEWVSVKDINSKAGMRGGDYAKLRYWGLIEQMPANTDPTKRASGYWRPTEQGISFAEGHITVQKKTKTYDKKLLGFEGELVSIHDALGTKFNYEELMGNN